MRKEMSFWMLIILMVSSLISLGYVTAAHSEEAYSNGEVYALLYESKEDIPFSTNTPKKHDIPAFVKRGEMRCDGFKEESLTQGGAVVTTCIEIPPSGRYPITSGVPA